MVIHERGAGTPLILVPSIHGRWEYLRPAIDALAEFFRVVTFSLSDEPSSWCSFDATLGLDNFVRQIDEAMQRTNAVPAVVCGVSFGGLVALRFAAARPAATAALVLASTPGPGWHLRPRHAAYARVPWLGGPLFAIETPRRLAAELRAAFPDPRERRRFAFDQLRLAVRRPLSPARMARRALMIESCDVRAWSAKVAAPTLVVTGEPSLDHVVSADGSIEYVRMIPGGRHAMLERTGHLGTITRPLAFADIVRRFTREAVHAAA